MRLMAFDPSVRGFAWATCLLDFRGRTTPELVHTGRFDGGLLSRKATETEHGARCDRILRYLDSILCAWPSDVYGFESYGWSAKPDTDVVELVGCVKRMIRQGQPDAVIETINQSGARAFLLAPAKVPRKGLDAKKACALAIGPALRDRSLDETDAIVVLNDMCYRHGGQSLV